MAELGRDQDFQAIRWFARRSLYLKKHRTLQQKSDNKKLDKKSDEDLIKKAEEEEWNQIDDEVKKKLPKVENPGGR